MSKFFCYLGKHSISDWEFHEIFRKDTGPETYMEQTRGTYHWKFQQGMNFLKMVTETWRGSDVQTSLLFYRSYIRSIIDYGWILYRSASKTVLNKIDVIQESALRICIEAMRSTPIHPLHVETLEPLRTLHIYCRSYCHIWAPFVH